MKTRTTKIFRAKYNPGGKTSGKEINIVADDIDSAMLIAKEVLDRVDELKRISAVVFERDHYQMMLASRNNREL